MTCSAEESVTRLGAGQGRDPRIDTEAGVRGLQVIVERLRRYADPVRSGSEGGAVRHRAQTLVLARGQAPGRRFAPRGYLVQGRLVMRAPRVPAELVQHRPVAPKAGPSTGSQTGFGTNTESTAGSRTGSPTD